MYVSIYYVAHIYLHIHAVIHTYLVQHSYIEYIYIYSIYIGTYVRTKFIYIYICTEVRTHIYICTYVQGFIQNSSDWYRYLYSKCGRAKHRKMVGLACQVSQYAKSYVAGWTGQFLHAFICEAYDFYSSSPVYFGNTLLCT
jgi:hypothetical protein